MARDTPKDTRDDAPDTTLEFFFILHRPVTSKIRLEAIAEAIDAFPADWVRYDQNLMSSWKTYSGERLVVDAQTQRTAMIRIEGEGGAMALLALGKRGEPPTLILRSVFGPLHEERTFSDAATFFMRAVARAGGDTGMPLVRGGVAPKSARDAWHREHPALNEMAGLAIPAWRVCVARADDPLADVDVSDAAALGARQPAGEYNVYDFLDAADVPVEDALERWREVADLIREEAARREASD